jgi:hypothetical protein
MSDIAVRLRRNSGVGWKPIISLRTTSPRHWSKCYGDRIMAALIIPNAQSTSRPSEELKRPPLDDADSQGQWRELSPVQARARCGGVTRVAG